VFSKFSRPQLAIPASRAALSGSPNVRQTARRAFLPEDALVLLATLGIVLGIFVALRTVAAAFPTPVAFAFNLYFYLLASALVLLGATAARLVAERPASPLRWLLTGGGQTGLRNAVRNGLPVVSVALFMPAFSAVKASIESFHAFNWDRTLIAVDRAIHGADAWRLLQPVMGHPVITWFASQLYHAWFALIYVGPILIAFYLSERTLRLRFFLAYLATWTLVGVVLATLLASVGPCFVKPILGLPDFAAQAEYLQHANRIHHLAVLDVQEQLLAWYRTHDRGLGRGITAMPSMHVSLAWLYFLTCRRIDRRLGWSALAFALAVFASSIHLGYHYAVDGYVAVIAVSAIWLACGRVSAMLLTSLDRAVDTDCAAGATV
jgi:hypothetical protein